MHSGNGGCQRRSDFNTGRLILVSLPYHDYFNIDIYMYFKIILIDLLLNYVIALHRHKV